MEAHYKKEIDNCVEFLFTRITKEINVFNDDFYNDVIDYYKKDKVPINKNNKFFNIQNYEKILKIISEKNGDLLFYKFFFIVHFDNIFLDDKKFCFFIIKILLYIFKNLKSSINTFNDINIILYQDYYTNVLAAIESIELLSEQFKLEKNMNINKIFPKNITHSKLFNLLGTTIDENYKKFSKAITSMDIMKFIRIFLLYILNKQYVYLYYNLLNFEKIFLKEDFIHYNYIVAIKKNNLDLLSDIIYKPNIKKFIINDYYNIIKAHGYKLNCCDLNNCVDLSEFCNYIESINSIFISSNEHITIDYSIIYFFVLFSYKKFNFFNKKNIKLYSYLINNLINKVIIPNIFEYDKFDNDNYIIIKKIFSIDFNFINEEIIIMLSFGILKELSLIIDNEIFNCINEKKNYYENLKDKYTNILYIVNLIPFDCKEKLNLIVNIRNLLSIVYDIINKFNV